MLAVNGDSFLSLLKSEAADVRQSHMLSTMTMTPLSEYDHLHAKARVPHLAALWGDTKHHVPLTLVLRLPNLLHSHYHRECMTHGIGMLSARFGETRTMGDELSKIYPRLAATFLTSDTGVSDLSSGFLMSSPQLGLVLITGPHTFSAVGHVCRKRAYAINQLSHARRGLGSHHPNPIVVPDNPSPQCPSNEPQLSS